MTSTRTTPVQTQPPASAPQDPRRQLTWRRWRSGASIFALLCLVLGALGQALGTVVAGKLAEASSLSLVGWFALTVVGGAMVATVGRVVWAGVSDRAEGALRDDLLSAALHQPLPVLSEQAVGEILDRVDDDTHEVGSLVRQPVWMAMRTVAAVIPLWIISALTWWPAWVVFPLLGWLTWVAIRRLLPVIARLKVIEEMAWTDHAAALEEGVAARDDLRTSLGQPFAVSRLAKLSALAHARFDDVIRVEGRMILRASLLTSALLAGTVVAGIAAAQRGSMSVAQLVTLFLTTSFLVGQVERLAHQLPDLQAGLGAIFRLRQMLESPPEPVGGQALPQGPLDLRFDDLSFSYDEGDFALQDIDLHVPAGATMALIGRTGSGKSTLASLISRAVEPPYGQVLLGGVDVRDLDLQELRAAIGVVTQRTEILAGTLAQNITLFTDLPRTQVEGAVAELGLTDWVETLPAGLDTLLGPGGTTLSAGEEQLVAFARLLVREVRLVVLDEATARMDPLTESRVVAASERLLARRTGILVAHRLTTIARADLVTVLDRGRVVQTGRRAQLAQEPGAFRRLLEAGDGVPDAATDDAPQGPAHDPDTDTVDAAPGAPAAVGAARRVTDIPDREPVGTGPSLTRGIAHALCVRPAWGLVSIALFLGSALLGSLGAITGWIWGHVVEQLRDGALSLGWPVAMVLALMVAPFMITEAIKRYPRWWVEVLLRSRMQVLRGQIQPHRLPSAPPGEVVARAMDADRYARYADRWVDFINGIGIVIVTALMAGTPWAGLVLLGVLAAAAVSSVLGRPIAGRSATRAAAARAGFGRSLVSALESARTVKLAGRTPQVHAHLREVDSGRVAAAVREHRVQAVLDGIPVIMVQVGAVAAWWAYDAGSWSLAITLLVVNAVNGFDWFGQVAGAIVTEAPGTRAWQKETARFAGGSDLMDLPAGVDLVAGSAPLPQEPPSERRRPLESVELRDLSVVHDDGTVGVEGVDLTVRRGELVLLLGQIGSGKSSLLRSLAGLLDHTGELRWNGAQVEDPETFLRPGRVAHVAQVPRVLSGTFVQNVGLGYGDRPFEQPVADARLSPDVRDAGGPDALVGHRGVRLSGGQVQRLALARALATEADLLLADDVSSALDAATEIELWRALRSRAMTVIGATSKRAALAQADRVVVLDEGRVAAVGRWSDLQEEYGHLAG